MKSFKRQIYKFGLIEDDDKNPPTVDDNSAEYTTGVFEFNTSHFTNNFQDPDGDSHELTRIRTLPSVGTLKYSNNPVDIGFTFDLDNVSQLTYELPDNYMITSSGYCSFDKPISTIISEQETEGFNLTYLGSGRLEFEKITSSTLPNDTDIYAFFDATSMKIEDAIAANEALVEWHTQYREDNDLYTGDLYVLPIVKETWLDFPNIIRRGSSNRVSNNSDAPDRDYMAFASIPPNFDRTSNDINSNWTAPTNVVVLAFIDESADGTEAYHLNRNGYGFSGQPSSQYLKDYKEFVDNYNHWNFFKGIFYPIPDIEFGNYNNIYNASVLQGFGAIEGEPTYTLEEIEDLGVTFARERRFHWHLDPTNPYYTGTSLTVANPYSEEAQTPVPNTSYNVKGLKEFGWAGVYDKDQPASSVFTSDTFNSDLNKYLQGSITQTREEKIIEGECIESDDICFDFQTSDDSKYNLFSNIATFCFTGTNDPDNVQQATPPTVDSVNRDYDKNLYQLVLDDFTNNFSDADGDSYQNSKILSSVTSSKGIKVGNIKDGGNNITYPFEFNLNNVSNLTFELEGNYYIINNRLNKFDVDLFTEIANLKSQGYSILENQGNKLIFNKLNTSDPQNPTVDLETIEGKDMGSESICLPFKTSDDSQFLLYSNTANLCLEMADDNTPPTVEGWSGVLSVNEFVFVESNFTTNFTDSEMDLPNSVRIESIPETNFGVLEFMGHPIETPFSFNIADVGELKFILPERFVFQGDKVYSFDKSVSEHESEQGALGYTLDSNQGGILIFSNVIGEDIEYKYIVGNEVTMAEYCFNFSTSDDNEIPLFSNQAEVCLTVPDSETEIEFNQPPKVGDNEITLE